jgi:hypothetical protein
MTPIKLSEKFTIYMGKYNNEFSIDEFLKYAKTFEGFANIHSNKIEKKEVKMKIEKKQPRQDEIDTEKVQEIISVEFASLEKKYSQRLIKRACYRYNQAIVEKNKAEKEIKVLEQRLAQAKGKLK